MTTWDEPLGRHLPKVGPARIAWWKVALFLLGAGGALFGLLAAYKFATQPKATVAAFARSQKYGTLRQIALEWRRLIALGEMPPAVEVWKLQGPMGEPQNAELNANAASAPYFVFALPFEAGAPAPKDKSFDHAVARTPEARFIASAKQLLPSIPEFELGTEMLSLGAIVVELKAPDSEGENTRLIASALSPEDGYGYPKQLQASLKLKAYEGCLPKGDDIALAEGLLSHPLGEKSNYWLARHADALTVVEVGDGCKFNDAKKVALSPGQVWSATQDATGALYVVLPSAEALSLWSYAGGAQRFCKQRWSQAFVGGKSCEESEVLALPPGAAVNTKVDVKAQPFSPLQLIVNQAPRGAVLGKGTWHLVAVPDRENVWAFSGCAAPEEGRFRIVEQAGCVPVEEEASLIGTVKTLGKDIEFVDPAEKVRSGGEFRVKSLNAVAAPACVVQVVPEPCPSP